MNIASEFSRTYNSFSGVDIQASFAGIHISDLQGISFTVTREKGPLYTLGSPNPRAFSRGKRGIAGSLIFLVFDRSALLEGLGEHSIFWSDLNEITASKQRRSAGDDLQPQAGRGGPEREGTAVPALAWYVDQIPPFSVVLTAINEYGHMARMEIRGVEILNSGSGISVDDITVDENMTWVATEIIPWKAEAFIPPDPTQAVTDLANNAAAIA
jgi:hypothetical protein